MQRLHRDTESETVGRGQLSVIPVTTRPEHSLSALSASFDLLIGKCTNIDMYQILPPLQMRMTETKEIFQKDSIMQLKWKVCQRLPLMNDRHYWCKMFTIINVENRINIQLEGKEEFHKHHLRQ